MPVLNVNGQLLVRTVASIEDSRVTNETPRPSDVSLQFLTLARLLTRLWSLDGEEGLFFRIDEHCDAFTYRCPRLSCILEETREFDVTILEAIPSVSTAVTRLCASSLWRKHVN